VPLGLRLGEHGLSTLIDQRFRIARCPSGHTDTARAHGRSDPAWSPQWPGGELTETGPTSTFNAAVTVQCVHIRTGDLTVTHGAGAAHARDVYVLLSSSYFTTWPRAGGAATS
jgi:hypothetical protein